MADLSEVLDHIRNDFHVEGGQHEGSFVIKDGSLDLPFMLEGQFFKIEDSALNDGVYQYPAFTLRDEEFVGCVTALAIPQAFLELVDDIDAWCIKYASVDASAPYSSESFGGYSYTRATNANGKPYSWKDAFGSRLNTWRKM